MHFEDIFYAVPVILQACCANATKGKTLIGFWFWGLLMIIYIAWIFYWNRWWLVVHVCVSAVCSFGKWNRQGSETSSLNCICNFWYCIQMRRHSADTWRHSSKLYEAQLYNCLLFNQDILRFLLVIITFMQMKIQKNSPLICEKKEDFLLNQKLTKANIPMP